jgi:hypothetical protein
MFDMSKTTFMQACGIGCVALAVWGMWRDLKRFPRQMWQEIHDLGIVLFGGIPETQHTPLNALDPMEEAARIGYETAGVCYPESFESDYQPEPVNLWVPIVGQAIQQPAYHGMVQAAKTGRN